MPHMVIAGPVHDAGLALVDDAPDVTFDYVPDTDPTAYRVHLPKADGLVLRTQPLTAADVASAPRLRIVSRHGVGYDAVDVAALDARSIPLAIVGDVNSRTVAEHAMMLLLAASRKLVDSANRFRAGDWAQRNAFAPREIFGKTLLIIGYGRIGRYLAVLADAFGVRVLAYDPFIAADAFGDVERVTDLRQGLASSDLVSIHAPKGDDVLIGAAELASMKPDAVIVNTARGGQIDEAALADALRTGRIGAAGLDVLADEPPPADHPLLRLDNAILTPHTAGLTQECAQRMAIVSIRNVLDHFNGRLDPALVVNGV